MAYLEVTNPSAKPTIYLLGEGETSIGRKKGCHILVDSSFVSGVHALIARGDEGFVIQDLTSHNGTFVNGHRVKEVFLKDGDKISFADKEAFFYDRPVSHVVLRDDQQELGEDSLIKRDTRDSPVLPQLLSSTEAGELLRRIQEVILEATGVKQMLEDALEVASDVIPSDRAYVLLKDEDDELIPMAVRRQSGSGAKEITLSRTLVERTIEDECGFLTADAQVAGDNWNPSVSVINLNIRSSLCAPIWTGKEINGLLYMDDRTMRAKFTEEHLNMLVAVGFLVAMGLERLRLMEEAKREELVQINLQRYHSPDVVDMILKTSKEGGEMLAATETRATVLFADIVGFTKLAESLPPGELADFLNDFLSLASEFVFDYQGTLDKYLGDGIMAVFGAPVCRPDDAVRAVKAAIKMRDDLPGLMSSSRHKIRKLSLRVGINTGRVVAGNFGSYRRMEYTAIGDTVNVASRLQEICEPGCVMISDSTYQDVKDHFICGTAGVKSLHNRSQPVTCYVVRERVKGDPES